MSKQKNQSVELADGSNPRAYLHRDLSTQNQIQMLLQVVGSTGAMLLNPLRELENIPGNGPNLTGEAALAATTTFIKACSTLDRILADESRWGMDFQLALEKQLAEEHKSFMDARASELAMHAEHKRAAELLQKPHWIYRPKLIALTDGTYAAFLGESPDNPAGGLVGIGGCPQEALNTFDDVFRGIPATPEWIAYLQERLNHLKTAVNESQVNEQTESDMDDGGNSESGISPSEGQDLGGDSENLGA